MKTKILIAIIAISATAFTSKFISTKETAIVNKEQGLYVYTDCKPTVEYEVIETLKCTNKWLDLKSFTSYTYDYGDFKSDIFKQITKKKNKEKFEEAEAIILYADQQKADVIKFKE